MPTPNDMPGAATAKAVIESEPTATDGASTPDNNGDTVVTDPQAEIARLTALVQQGRKWEERSKANAEKAKLWDANKDKVTQWDEHEAATRSKEEALVSERDKLRSDLERERQENLRNKVARELGISPRFVTGTTEDEMRESAEVFKNERDRDVEAALKALGVSPAAPASAVTSAEKANEVKQLTRADLTAMTRQQILAAEKNGQLDDLLGRKR